MNKVHLLLALGGTLFTQSNAQAAQIQFASLNCQGFQIGAGGQAIAYLLDGGTFSLSETNAFGIPTLSESLSLRSADLTGNRFTLVFYSSVQPDLTYILQLPRGTAAIAHFTAPTYSSDLDCISNIDVIR
jgi:hypothetical protein